MAVVVKAVRAADVGLAVGDTVKVFGKHVCEVKGLHRGGRMAHVVGATYKGFRKVADLKKMDDDFVVLGLA